MAILTRDVLNQPLNLSGLWYNRTVVLQPPAEKDLSLESQTVGQDKGLEITRSGGVADCWNTSSLTGETPWAPAADLTGAASQHASVCVAMPIST
jgi:hypothetical protein